MWKKTEMINWFMLCSILTIVNTQFNCKYISIYPKINLKGVGRKEIFQVLFSNEIHIQQQKKNNSVGLATKCWQTNFLQILRWFILVVELVNRSYIKRKQIFTSFNVHWYETNKLNNNDTMNCYYCCLVIHLEKFFFVENFFF